MAFPASVDVIASNKAGTTPRLGDHAIHHNSLATSITAVQNTLLGQATTGNLLLSSTVDNNNVPNAAVTITQTTAVGGAAAVPIGLLGQVVINSGSHSHSIGIAGRCLPSATSPIGSGYYGMEGRVDVGVTGGFGVGILGLASIANASSNVGSVVVGVRGRGELLTGTSTFGTMYGGWFTTNAPAGAVGSTYANAVFGDASNNVSTRFRGAGTGGLQAEALATVLSSGALEFDVTDANLAAGFKVKLGGGSSQFAIYNSANTLIAYISNLGSMALASQLLTVASAAGTSGIIIPHGTAPTSPNNGDLWTTTAGMFVRINGVTKTVTLT